MEVVVVARERYNIFRVVSCQDDVARPIDS